jgi:phage-related protein
MSFTTWIDGRVAVASVAIANALWDRFDKRFGEVEANIGSMFQTVSNDVKQTADTISGDVQNVANNLSGDITGVAGAVSKSTEDTINGVNRVIQGLLQPIIDILNRLPHFPGL